MDLKSIHEDVIKLSGKLLSVMLYSHYYHGKVFLKNTEPDTKTYPLDLVMLKYISDGILLPINSDDVTFDKFDKLIKQSTPEFIKMMVAGVRSDYRRLYTVLCCVRMLFENYSKLGIMYPCIHNVVYLSIIEHCTVTPDPLSVPYIVDISDKETSAVMSAYVASIENVYEACTQYFKMIQILIDIDIEKDVCINNSELYLETLNKAYVISLYLMWYMRILDYQDITDNKPADGDHPK
jgi:hypothetical protein